MKWPWTEWLKHRKQERARIHYEEMRRVSDDFGAGSLLRYGEDRWGVPKQERKPAK